MLFNICTWKLGGGGERMIPKKNARDNLKIMTYITNLQEAEGSGKGKSPCGHHECPLMFNDS